MDLYLLGRDGKPDVNVQAAVFGCESEMHGSSIETDQVSIYLGDRGGVVWKNSGYEFERVGVPLLGPAPELDRVRELGR